MGDDPRNGTLEIYYTVTKHPDPSHVGWMGVEAYHVEPKTNLSGGLTSSAEYWLNGAGLRPGNNQCTDVNLILGIPGGMMAGSYHGMIISKKLNGDLEAHVLQDQARFTLSR